MCRGSVWWLQRPDGEVPGISPRCCRTALLSTHSSCVFIKGQMSANISREAQAHGGYRGTLLIGRRVCSRETAVFALKERGASKSTTLNFDQTWMIIWQQCEKMSQWSIISDNVAATWAAGESPGLNASACEHAGTMSRDGLHETLQPRLHLQILAVNGWWWWGSVPPPLITLLLMLFHDLQLHYKSSNWWLLHAHA